MAIRFLKAVYKEDELNVRNHYHDCHQILLVTEGEAEVHLANSVYNATRGNILIFNRFEEHFIKITKGPYKRYVIDVSPKIDERTEVGYKLFSVLFNRPEGFNNIVDVSEHFDDFAELFGRIVKESGRADKANGEILGLYAQEFLLRLSACRPNLFETFEDEKCEMIYKIQKDFESNYNQDVSLEDLSKRYSISQSYLSHIFKSVTGKSVKGYLFACRIAAAKRYLANSEKRIGEIVALCGFSDCSNFSRVFKRTTGFSPVDFRRKYRDKEFVTVE
ncbi:MAG: AraC family transcriptional regulator [Candidatus Borkfalkiaceae bacterium]|nr:AraC family transcriptional regulator [Clostridia bacterium]MDY6222761.1 AraC family transcriptional regulator [Christensenellaceae bacterium]